MRRIICLCIAVFALQIISAQKATDQPVRIKNCNVRIKSNLFVAITTISIELYNPNNKVLDGEFQFDLADGQVITGFQLDINGKMREGVIVDKQQGRVAYENTIRRRIDPGLLELVQGNHFKVRVYPVAALNSRKISITFAQKLKRVNNELVYTLPLRSTDAVDNFSTSISVQNGSSARTGSGLLKDQKFQIVPTGFALSYSAKNILLAEPVNYSVQIDPTASTICHAGNYFALRTSVTIPTEKRSLKKVTVFWDISGSGKNRDIEKEQKILRAYLNEFTPDQLTFVTFSNQVDGVQRINHPAKNFSRIRALISDQVYDGGTQLGVLKPDNYEGDECILFSDGMNSFGKPAVYSQKPVIAIQSSVNGNSTALRNIAFNSGGKYINVLQVAEENFSGLFNFENRIESVSSPDGKQVLSARIEGSEIFAAGKVDNELKELTIKLRNGNDIRSISINTDQAAQCDTQSIAAAVMLNQLEELQQTAATESITAFAKANGLVTTSTSLIVLDNLQDYIDYDIMPPSDLKEQWLTMQATVARKKEDKNRMKEKEELASLQRTVNEYNRYILWWDPKETIIRLPELSKKQKSSEPVTFTDHDQQNRKIEERNLDGIGSNLFGAAKGLSNLNEVVVVGYSNMRRSDMAGSVAIVSGSALQGYTSVPQALQGKVAGLTVTNGTPSTELLNSIQLRGGRTLNDKEALYIIDGFASDRAAVNALPMGQIQSIDILKDANATAIYGSRGLNGVIVIRTKNPSREPVNGITVYDKLEDVDYVQELTGAGNKDKYALYLSLKEKHGTNAVFYFDVADVFFKAGMKDVAVKVLTNVTENDLDNHQLLRGMGFLLESWKDYENAIEVYKRVLDIKEEEPQSYRDLANAYNRAGNYQSAADLLYRLLGKTWNQYENRYSGMRSIVLNELSSIVQQHACDLSTGEYEPSVIKPLPVDLRVVIDWNKDETDIDLHVVEPGGEECSYKNKQTASGGKISDDFTDGYGPEEYEIKNAKSGKYRINVNYYGDRYQKVQVPSMIRVTIYKNFGKANQEMTIRNLVMDGQQSGMIEVATVKM